MKNWYATRHTLIWIMGILSFVLICSTLFGLISAINGEVSLAYPIADACFAGATGLWAWCAFQDQQAEDYTPPAKRT